MGAGADFVLLGHSLAVDFVNTELIENGTRVERLQSDADLLRWARAAGLSVPDASLGRADRQRLGPEVRALRAALRRLFEASADTTPPPAADLQMLNRQLTRPRSGARISFCDGAFTRSPALATDAPAVLEAIAEDAAQVLAGSALGLLRRCANQRCILLFVDRSRTGRRRWCSMQVCGNRAKVAAHGRRVKT
jgi:predicted RNA-binding Zn ribbon-like protein